MFEYKFEYVPLKKPMINVEKAIKDEVSALEKMSNSYANEGWKLLRTDLSYGEGNIILVFEREKTRF